MHPSNKKGRNFPSGNCNFGKECWYVHGDIVDTENTSDHFKCDKCCKEFTGRDKFMNHKKIVHPEFIPSCEKFSARKCARSDQECWFEHRRPAADKNPWPKLIPSPHPKTDASKKPVFREAAGPAFPPDKLNTMMEMISNLCSKVQRMEKNLEDLMN